MQNLLDHIFSSLWMMTTIVLILLLGIGFITSGTHFFQKKIYNWIYKSIFIASIVVMVTFLPKGYGFSRQVPVMQIIGNKLCLLDKMEKGDETSDWEEYRLHILNAETGEKLSRKFYEDISDIGYSKGDSLFLFGYWNYFVVDINTNEPIIKIDKDYLQNRFSEFSSGIESMDYSKKNKDGNQIQCIAITSKTAKTYYYDPFADALLANEKIQVQKVKSEFLKGDTYSMNDHQKVEEPIVSLEYSKESNKIKHLSFHNEEKDKNSEITKKDFLEAEILQIFQNQKVCIILSYETTDKLNFILDAIDFDGRSKWNIKQSELKLSDSYSKMPKLDVSIQYGDNLIFNCGGFIVSINVTTGKIDWKQRV